MPKLFFFERIGLKRCCSKVRIDWVDWSCCRYKNDAKTLQTNVKAVNRQSYRINSSADSTSRLGIQNITFTAHAACSPSNDSVYLLLTLDQVGRLQNRLVMSKGRTESSQNCQSQGAISPYLDSAYKQLLRQQQMNAALKNRTKVLQLTQQSMLRHIENNHNKWNRLESIKQNHSLQIAKIARRKEDRNLEAHKLKLDNETKRQLHLRQLSSVTLEKAQDIHRIKREAVALRQKNLRLIQQNREAEAHQKQSTRNKIHEDILESRATIKHFFDQKHHNIIAANSQDVDKLTLKRIKGELECRIAGEIGSMEEEVRQLRQELRESRVRPGESGVRPGEMGGVIKTAGRYGKYEQEEKHPLVRKIELAMNKYSKIM